MRRALLGFLLVMTGLKAAPAPAVVQLPAFPLPAFVEEGGSPTEISSARLLRELFRGGVRVANNFEAVDSDYALLRSDNTRAFAAWLERTCRELGFDLLQMRAGVYDPGTFARLLEVSASLAVLRKSDSAALAIPIGLLVCKREVAWGELKHDGALDGYILFATEVGILVYDPPTRQLTNLAEFPNKAGILRIRF